jgi:hypothetical protein
MISAQGERDWTSFGLKPTDSVSVSIFQKGPNDAFTFQQIGIFAREESLCVFTVAQRKIV